MREINTLVGHSGCDIKLVTENSILFVRKTSSEIKYNKRLEIQCFKQKEFKSVSVFAPKVLDFGYKNNLFYFDMEFINGQSFNTIIRNHDLKEIIFYFDIILKFISENLKNSSIINYKQEIKSKLKSLDIKYNIPKIIITDKASKLNSGYCHGDLTFENIIIKNNKVYLIDFLDSYIDSPIIDISKIKQDLILNWSNRFEKPNNLNLIKNQWLNNYLDFFVQKMDLSIEAIELQKKITLLRILPYTDNIFTQLKILKKI